VGCLSPTEASRFVGAGEWCGTVAEAEVSRFVPEPAVGAAASNALGATRVSFSILGSWVAAGVGSCATLEGSLGAIDDSGSICAVCASMVGAVSSGTEVFGAAAAGTAPGLLLAALGANFLPVVFSECVLVKLVSGPGGLTVDEGTEGRCRFGSLRLFVARGRRLRRAFLRRHCCGGLAQSKCLIVKSFIEHNGGEDGWSV
jgi:hypothetical protein